jgi:DNA-binding Xre family transcriptional regulator
VSAIERGTVSGIEFTTLEALARALEVDAALLIRDDGGPRRHG